MPSTTASSLKVRRSRGGLHLFDRRTGLNVLLDEIPIAPADWSPAPRHMSIALTTKCDLRCQHCFVPKDPSQLDFHRLTRWLEELDANGCLGVGFGGGEPTLYPHLAALCAHATSHTGLAVTLTTHGHGLRGPLLVALDGNVHFIRVSMDGVAATYEAIRHRPFSDLLQCLKVVGDFAPFGINFLVNARTLPDLDRAVEIAAELGASEFLLLPEVSANGSAGIDEHTTNALRSWVETYRGPMPLTVSEIGADGLPACNPVPCEHALAAYAHIDARGFIKASSLDGHGVEINELGVMTALKKLANTRGDSQ